VLPPLFHGGEHNNGEQNEARQPLSLEAPLARDMAALVNQMKKMRGPL
jgi:hypothetical protein